MTTRKISINDASGVLACSGKATWRSNGTCFITEADAPNVPYYDLEQFLLGEKDAEVGRVVECETEDGRWSVTIREDVRAMRPVVASMTRFVEMLIKAGRFSEVAASIDAAADGHLWAIENGDEFYIREATSPANALASFGSVAGNAVVYPIIIEREERALRGPVRPEFVDRVMRAYRLARSHSHAWGEEPIGALLAHWYRVGAPACWIEHVSRLAGIACGPAGGITAPTIVKDSFGRDCIEHKTWTGRLVWRIELDDDAWSLTVTRRAGRVFAERLRAAKTQEDREAILAELDGFRGDTITVGRVAYSSAGGLEYAFNPAMGTEHARVLLLAWRQVDLAWTPDAIASSLALVSDVPPALTEELAKMLADENLAGELDNEDDRLGGLFEGHAFVRDGIAVLPMFGGDRVRIAADEALRIMRSTDIGSEAMKALREAQA